MRLESEINEMWCQLESEINEMWCQLESEINETWCQLESEINEMWCQLESEINEMSCQLLEADVAESKMAREMLRFTIEPGVVGREGRICETAGAGHSRAIAVWFRIVTVV